MTKQTEIPAPKTPHVFPRSTTRCSRGSTSALERLAELGIDRYAYLDQFTGKRFVAKQPRPRRPRKEREPREKPDPAEQVEHRKVSRASVATEIDPFANVRDKLAGMGDATVVGDRRRREDHARARAVVSVTGDMLDENLASGYEAGFAAGRAEHSEAIIALRNVLDAFAPVLRGGFSTYAQQYALRRAREVVRAAEARGEPGERVGQTSTSGEAFADEEARA